MVDSSGRGTAEDVTAKYVIRTLSVRCFLAAMNSTILHGCALQTRPVNGEFIIMSRRASGTTLDNASASGRNPKLGLPQIRQHPVLVDVHPSLHSRSISRSEWSGW